MKNQKVTASQIEQEINLQQDVIYELLVQTRDGLIKEAAKLRRILTEKEVKLYGEEQSEYQMSENVTTFGTKGDYTRPIKTEYFGKLSIVN